MEIIVINITYTQSKRATSKNYKLLLLLNYGTREHEHEHEARLGPPSSHRNIEFIDQIFITPSCLLQVIFGSENGSCVEQHSESMAGKNFVPDLLL